MASPVICGANGSSDLVSPSTSHLFPHVIADLLRTYGVSDLSLSLTQGFYRPTHWGYAVQPHASPHGARVRAVFDVDMTRDDDDGVDLRWRDLVHALSGYFCASLSTMHPKYTNEPSSLTSSVNRSTHAERAGILSSENVCTENLTPWKKLLPCKKVCFSKMWSPSKKISFLQRGLASLLNAESLVARAHHYSLGVHVRRICGQGVRGRF